MKVLQICPSYFQNILYDKLFISLHYLRVTNEVFTLSLKNNIKYDNKSYNITIFNKEFSIIDRILFFRKQYSIFRRMCKDYSIFEFNIIHAHTLFSSGYVAFLLHKKFAIPYIIAVRNTDINVFYKYMFHLRGLGFAILKDAKNIIFLSPSYREFTINHLVPLKYRHMILEKSVVIPNGIDEYFLNNKYLSRRTICKNIIRLIYIGEINDNKNIKTTIKACKILIEKGYKIDFTIIGEIVSNKYKSILTKYDFIKYHTKCSKEDLIYFLRRSEVFIMPSIHETFGLVYAEAMSQGLPVIYSKGQGFDNQFDNGIIGYAVDSFDFKEIANKIIELIYNYQQFSINCLSLVDKFDWATIANEYKRLYSNNDKMQC